VLVVGDVPEADDFDRRLRSRLRDAAVDLNMPPRARLQAGPGSLVGYLGTQSAGPGGGTGQAGLEADSGDAEGEGGISGGGTGTVPVERARQTGREGLQNRAKRLYFCAKRLFFCA